MRFVLAFVLAAHGVAHLVGFVSSWKLATLAELPYKTTIFSGRLDMGGAGIRVIGVLWLLGVLALLIAAIALATGTGWAGRFMLAAVIASALLVVDGVAAQVRCPIAQLTKGRHELGPQALTGRAPSHFGQLSS